MARGDHLRVHRGGYWHHGIDIGDGSVVHFDGHPLSIADATVKRTWMRTFTKGDDVEVVPYETGAALRTPDHTCVVALSLLGTADYNLFANNCELFALFCKTTRGMNPNAGSGLWDHLREGVLRFFGAAVGYQPAACPDQVDDVMRRAWNYSRYGARDPRLLLVGPAVEGARVLAQNLWKNLCDLGRPSDVDIPFEAPPQLSFFHVRDVHRSQDGLWWYQSPYGSWTDGQGQPVFPTGLPALSFVGREFYDDVMASDQQPNRYLVLPDSSVYAVNDQGIRFALCETRFVSPEGKEVVQTAGGWWVQAPGGWAQVTQPIPGLIFAALGFEAPDRARWLYNRRGWWRAA